MIIRLLDSFMKVGIRCHISGLRGSCDRCPQGFNIVLREMDGSLAINYNTKMPSIFKSINSDSYYKVFAS